MSRQRKTTRREFLKGRSAAEELLDIAGGLNESQPLPPPASGQTGDYLFHLSRAAMACDFEVFFRGDESPQSHETALEALDLVDALEDQMSVYRDQSEISRLNRAAAIAPVVVESRLFRLLQLAVEIHALSSGAFDITAGPLTRAWGFYRRVGRIPTDDEIRAALEGVGSQWLELDPARETVRFLRPGIEINLGAIGKGYALDRCAERFETAGLANYLLHGGMSSVLARGSRNAMGGVNSKSRNATEGVPYSAEDNPSSAEDNPSSAEDEAATGWRVGVVHPQRPERRLAEIVLRDRALGTSGAGTQYFHFQGRRYGHLLDPRTGHPAEGVLSATVLAPTAAEADALATACYVLGVKKALELCRTRPELAALLVTPAPRSGSVEIHTVGLADDEWRAL